MSFTIDNQNLNLAIQNSQSLPQDLKLAGIVAKIREIKKYELNRNRLTDYDIIKLLAPKLRDATLQHHDGLYIAFQNWSGLKMASLATRVSFNLSQQNLRLQDVILCIKDLFTTIVSRARTGDWFGYKTQIEALTKEERKRLGEHFLTTDELKEFGTQKLQEYTSATFEQRECIRNDFFIKILKTFGKFHPEEKEKQELLDIRAKMEPTPLEKDCVQSCEKLRILFTLIKSPKLEEETLQAVNEYTKELERAKELSQNNTATIQEPNPASKIEQKKNEILKRIPCEKDSFKDVRKELTSFFLNIEETLIEYVESDFKNFAEQKISEYTLLDEGARYKLRDLIRQRFEDVQKLVNRNDIGYARLDGILRQANREMNLIDQAKSDA
jgi:hypothetical protein